MSHDIPLVLSRADKTESPAHWLSFRFRYILCLLKFKVINLYFREKKTLMLIIAPAKLNEVFGQEEIKIFSQILL